MKINKMMKCSFGKKQAFISFILHHTFLIGIIGFKITSSKLQVTGILAKILYGKIIVTNKLTMSDNTRTRGDKRKNLNWDLLPPKPVKENIAFCLYKTHVEGLPTEHNDDNVAVQINIEDQWKNLHNQNKHPYMTSAASLYAQQISAWQDKKRELKRPAGAFAMFMTDMWTEEKSKGRRLMLGEISRKAKLAWARASTAKKLEYKTKAKEALIRYNAFYEGFRQGRREGIQDNGPPNQDDPETVNDDSQP